MSEENVEIVQAAYDALNRENWDGVFRYAHPDLEFTFQRAPDPGPHRGRDAIQRRLPKQREPFESLTVEPKEYFESGEQVVAYITTRGKPRGAAAEIEVQVGHLWTIRDGRVVSVMLFPKREEALQAAGLSE